MLSYVLGIKSIKVSFRLQRTHRRNHNQTINRLQYMTSGVQ